MKCNVDIRKDLQVISSSQVARPFSKGSALAPSTMRSRWFYRAEFVTASAFLFFLSAGPSARFIVNFCVPPARLWFNFCSVGRGDVLLSDSPTSGKARFMKPETAQKFSAVMHCKAMRAGDTYSVTRVSFLDQAPVPEGTCTL